MTTIRMTKRFVINALKSERGRLTTGFFLDGGRDDSSVTVSDPRCMTCAVGGIIGAAVAADTLATRAQRHLSRQIGRTNCSWAPTDTTLARANAERFIASEPLPALSQLFESLADAHGPREAHRRVVMFAARRLPSHITVDIDGMKPRKARGITVLKGKRAR